MKSIWNQKRLKKKKKAVSACKISSFSGSTGKTTEFDEPSYHAQVSSHVDEHCQESSFSQMFPPPHLRNWVLAYHRELRIFLHMAFLPQRRILGCEVFPFSERQY